MNLALIIDDYLPHSTRVGAKMFHELAQELLKRGHGVTVITPSVNQHENLDIATFDNVNVWRFKNGPIKDVSHAKRAINETFLSVRGWKAIKSLVKADTFDGIIYYSPSIFWGGLVKKIKQRCHCQAYLVLRDIFPQWAVDGGMIKAGSLIERYFRFFEQRSYRQAKTIGLMSENNVTQFRQKNAQLSSEVLRNWADLNPENHTPAGYVPIRTMLNLADKVIFFYGGNIGHAQDMANLMRLTKNMQHYEQAHFLYVGQGDEVELINTIAQKEALKNVTYLPSVDQETFKAILSEVDVGLFSLAANHTAFNFPGKLLGYMVKSIPILGSVNAGNDLEQIVNDRGAGFIHRNGEDDNLLQSAIVLLENKSLRVEMGYHGYQLLKDEFSVSHAANMIEHSLEMKHESH